MTSFGLLGILFCLSFDLAFGRIGVGQVKYEGFLNVWHNGTRHVTMDASQAGADEVTVRNSCANFCTLSVDCDAFYIEDKADGSCHLVDEDLEPDVSRTVGHGWATEKVYYVKTVLDVVSATNSSQNIESISVPAEVVPPCDKDEATLSAADCAAFPAQMITYLTCPDSTFTYAGTTSLISDAKCDGEDRLLQCEFQDGTVTTNIVLNKEELFRRAFTKTVFEPLGLSSEDLEYFTITFANGAKRVTRVIIRSGSGDTEHLRTGQLILHNAAGQRHVVDLDFETNLKCACHVNFAAVGDSAPALSFAATKLEVNNLSWLGFTKPKGLKMDVFVREAEVAPSGAEPPSAR